MCNFCGISLKNSPTSCASSIKHVLETCPKLKTAKLNAGLLKENTVVNACDSSIPCISCIKEPKDSSFVFRIIVFILQFLNFYKLINLKKILRGKERSMTKIMLCVHTPILEINL